MRSLRHPELGESLEGHGGEEGEGFAQSLGEGREGDAELTHGAEDDGNPSLLGRQDRRGLRSEGGPGQGPASRGVGQVQVRGNESRWLRVKAFQGGDPANVQVLQLGSPGWSRDVLPELAFTFRPILQYSVDWAEQAHWEAQEHRDQVQTKLLEAQTQLKRAKSIAKISSVEPELAILRSKVHKVYREALLDPDRAQQATRRYPQNAKVDGSHPHRRRE
ncbi:unnamed protein product [Prorocentrum cordatum]|uniref:Uncharacterized protein n=1 Tax=Prorocentrum cordatum TaxID=2364126 RepID=A0ABN9VAQ6_9DINO|nr:unnamed protein product [Polarella glacialis]